MVVVDGRTLRNIRTQRSGVIPYVCHRGTTYFLLGKDKKFQEYCDFGGGTKKNESAIQTGMREFQEETSNMFDSQTYSTDFEDSRLAIMYNNMAVLFVPVKVEWLLQAEKLFPGNSEISDVVWFTYDDICRLIRSDKMWKRLRKVLTGNLNKITLETLISWYKCSSPFGLCKFYFD